MTEQEFLKECEANNCTYILKGPAARIDKGINYWIYGIKNGYITCTLPVNYYGKYLLFDELKFREYYPLKNLINGEQIKLL